MSLCLASLYSHFTLLKRWELLAPYQLFLPSLPRYLALLPLPFSKKSVPAANRQSALYLTQVLSLPMVYLWGRFCFLSIYFVGFPPSVYFLQRPRCRHWAKGSIFCGYGVSAAFSSAVQHWSIWSKRTDHNFWIVRKLLWPKHRLLEKEALGVGFIFNQLWSEWFVDVSVEFWAKLNSISCSL